MFTLRQGRGWKVETVQPRHGRRRRGGHRHRRGQARRGACATERRPPRAARAGHRSERPHPHLYRDGRGPARGRGSGHQDRPEGSARGHVLFERAWRPEREHDVLRRAHHAPADRPRRVAAGREVTDQKPRESAEGAALAPLRDRDAQAAGRDRAGAPRPGRQRRSIREDPHLQLQREPHHRSPHQLHDASAAGRARGQHRSGDRPAHGARPGRSTEALTETPSDDAA